MQTLCDNTSLFSQAFPDNAVRREVENLSAVCINESCTWTGSIKEYEVRRTHTSLSSLCGGLQLSSDSYSVCVCVFR